MNHADKGQSPCNQSQNLTRPNSVRPQPHHTVMSPVMGEGVPFIIVMAKDPAFLFYFQDFLVGTEFMSAEEVGCYIRILCHLADKKRLSEKHMISICRGCAFTDALRSKFKIDAEGLFYNERLAFEVEKRRLYSESRRKNAKAYAQHMENENRNENINKDRDENALNQCNDLFLKFWSSYPKKKSKGQAYKAWLKIKPSGELVRMILDKIEEAKTSYDWSKDGGQFIPYPATWLNAQGWEDDYRSRPTLSKRDQQRMKVAEKLKGLNEHGKEDIPTRDALPYRSVS